MEYLDGLMQERRNSSALAVELRLSSINQSIWKAQWKHSYIWLFGLPEIAWHHPQTSG